jgi:hypothetical protein
LLQTVTMDPFDKAEASHLEGRRGSH